MLVISDRRLVKEDVRRARSRARPVAASAAGRFATTAGRHPSGQESVGVLGQEIEKVFPEMIRRVPGGLDGEPDVETSDLRRVRPSLCAGQCRERTGGKVDSWKGAR